MKEKALQKEVEDNFYPKEMGKKYKTNFSKKLHHFIKKVVKEMVSYGDVNKYPENMVISEILKYILKNGANYLTPESGEN